MPPSGDRRPPPIAVLVAVAVVVLSVVDGPAAWADASSWSGEVDRLQRDGYVVRAIANPLRALTSDAADVADFLKTIAGPIVLVGHSYGGSVITNAAATERQNLRSRRGTGHALRPGALSRRPHR
jgi:pimeloyl-ACP methyl ester carboxylesterase